MKHIIILAGLLFITASSFSQASIAKIKYEQAEELFVASDFTSALVKLDEAEKILGSTNAKLMYLRIVCQSKLLEQSPDNNFRVIAAAKKNCNNYLVKYETLADNEDKYREIYKISEVLEKYPKTEEGFNAYVSGIKGQQKKKEVSLALQEKIKGWDASISGVKIGMGAYEIPSYVLSSLPTRFEFTKGQYGLDRDCISYSQKMKGMKLRYKEGLQTIYVDKAENKVCLVSYLHLIGGKGEFNSGEETYNKIKSKMVAFFGPEFAKETITDTTIDKMRMVGKSTIVDMGNNLIYSVGLSQINYNNILGNEVSVTESYSIMKSNQ